MRALSILLVFTAHPAYREVWPLFHGSTGVTIFFVLSGFLITTLLLREEDRNGRVNLRAFYIRRMFRIYPVFFAVLLLYCVLLLVVGLQPHQRGVFLENLPYFVFLFPEHGFFFNDTGTSVPFVHSWSIGIEEKFYLVWPIVGFVILAKWQRARLPILLLIAAASLAAGFAGPGWDAISSYQHIAYGAIAAILLHKKTSYQALSGVGRPKVLGIVALAALALQFGTEEVVIRGVLYGPFGMVVVVLLVGLVTTGSRGASWLGSRPMVYLGALSYVLYLIHTFGLDIAEKIIPIGWGFPGSVLSTVLGLAGATLAAHLIHKFFEEPLRLYGSKLSKSGRQVRAMHAPEPDKVP